MKKYIPAFLALIAISQCAGAVDASDKSPYDKHPECLDRNVDSSKGDCIIKDDGTPRHTYPQRLKVTPNSPGTPSTPAVTAPRNGAPAALRKGS